MLNGFFTFLWQKANFFKAETRLLIIARLQPHLETKGNPLLHSYKILKTLILFHFISFGKTMVSYILMI